jgi:hypothetical protein
MPIYPEASWIVATADQDGQTILLRMRDAMPDAAARAAYPQLVVIGWPYDGVESGMPTEADAAAMQRCEDAIEAGLGDETLGLQVASLTGAGHKEWRYYASDADAFVERLNASLEDHGAYPLEIEMFDDAEWEGLQQVLDGADDDDGGDDDDTDDDGAEDT